MSTPSSPTASDFSIISAPTSGENPRIAALDTHKDSPANIASEAAFPGNDDLIVIQVEEWLYRVALSILRKSELLQVNLGAEGAYKGKVGLDDVHPLVLENLSASQMDAFLEVLEIKVYATANILPLKLLIPALHVATIYQFTAFSGFIASQIEKAMQVCDPFECIELASSYDVTPWIYQAYQRLCESDKHLTVDEGNILGMARALAICNTKLLRLEARVRGNTFNIDGHLRQLSVLADMPPEPLSISFVPPLTLKRHPAHYQEDSIWVKIGEKLHSVRRKLLGESVLATRAFGPSPPLSRIVACGAPIENSELSNLLQILKAKETSDLDGLGFSEWAAALRLAHRLELHLVKRFSIACITPKLDGQSPVEVISLAWDCAMPQWLHAQYAALCERTETLTDIEAEQLGSRCAAAIFRIREKRLAARISSKPKRSPPPTDMLISEEPTLRASNVA